jgi:hypothetical protein
LAVRAEPDRLTGTAIARTAIARTQLDLALP